MLNNLSSFASVFFFETTYGVDWGWTGGGLEVGGGLFIYLYMLRLM